MQQQQQTPGAKIFAEYLSNNGGLNSADTPFAVRDDQATGGYNYDYTKLGGFQKSLCPLAINAAADAQLRTLGLGLRNTKGSTKSIIRAAGTKLQVMDLGGSFTNLAEDTAAAGTDFLASGSTQPVVNAMFITPSTDVLWHAGGGMSRPYGVLSCQQASNATLKAQGLTFTAVATDTTGNSISVAFVGGAAAGSETVAVSGTTITVGIQSGTSTTAQVANAILSSSAASALVSVSFSASSPVSVMSASSLTGGGATYPVQTLVSKNGVDAPTGSLSATETTTSNGQWAAAGTYYYGVAYRKKTTGALSNVALDIEATVTDTTGVQTISLSGLTNLDATKYDAIYLFRSALNGASGFTAGDLVAILDPTTTSFVDQGYDLAGAQNIARAGNIVLDNSTLPAGTYNSLVAWKRRLVTASGSTVTISDINKPESWPLTNTIIIPSGGAITGLAVVSFTPDAVNTDEFLVVFKESECWIITGTSPDDWALKYVDSCGTLSQTLAVSASGYLFFVDNRGCYLWDGTGKPIYISRPIEDLWGQNGKLDRSKLAMGSGVFFKRQNQIVWFLSHDDVGEQVFLLKLDLRRTLPQLKAILGERVVDGCFLPGKVANPVYASASFVYPTASNQEHVLLTGDGAGYVYRQFYSTAGVGANDYDFSYVTKSLDMGKPSLVKQFYQVVVWVENLGNWPLTLDYWTEWRAGDTDCNTIPQTVNANTDGTIALWDIAKWDQAKWDSYVSKPRRLVFNLNAAPYNNNQGEVLRLRFRNQNSDQPISVYGFGVYYADMSSRS